MSINFNKAFNFIVDPILTLIQDKCICTLITIGEYNLLFDCGWNEKFTQTIKKKYEDRLKNIKLDAIFLSNNYINYFGALPLVKSFPQNSDTKVYATTPIVNLGIFVMIDAYISNLEYNENSLNHLNINQESLSKIFYNINKTNFLQSIILNKNNIEDDILTIIPISSGTSMGGSAWTCNYRLFNFVYASEFSIEPKIIADPFPYKKLKKINFFITDNTDNKYQNENEVPIIRNVISEDFNKKIRECLENKKGIFIPSDNINSMLEMITKFQRLLDEYKEAYSNKIDKPEYKILVCSNCSNEIIEGLKSLTEFLGKKVSQQYCCYGEKLFNFVDVICIKNLDEFKTEANKKNVKYIILATFETLNIGLGYSILPYLLTDSNIVLINIFREYDYNSMFGNIIKQVKNLKNNSLSYKEKKVVERKKTEKKEKDEENVEMKNDNIKNNIDLSENINDNKVKNNIINNSSYKMVIEKEKLFNLPLNNNGYLSFNLESKYKYTDYGMELSNEEIEIMKKNNESENTTYNSNFLNFKRELENKDKKEMNLELTEFCLPTKIETKESKLEIKCDFLFYPMINNIDFMSKKLIIEEIKPKDGIILIGYSNVLSDKLKLNNMKCYVLTNNENDKYEQKLINNIIPFNFTSEDLHSGQKIIIEKGNENIYSFDSLLLSVKTKREQLIDVSIVSNKYKKIEENKKDKIKVVNEESQNDKIFSQNNLKLINIKHHIENNSNIKLLINEQKLKTLDKSVEVYIKDGELVIEGEFNEQYFNIKSKINNFYLNNIEK
jgi:hypothetical protein